MLQSQQKKKRIKEKLLRLVMVVTAGAGAFWLIDYLHLSGTMGTLINLIIVLVVLLCFVL